MKEYINNIGIEVALAGIGLISTIVGWLIGKLTTYKQHIIDKAINEVAIDNKQNSRLLRIEVKIAELERIIARLDKELSALKRENTELEDKLFRHMDRVEGKIDQVYTLMVSRADGKE